MSKVRVVSVSLRLEVLERLDSLAARDGMNRSEKIAALVDKSESRAPDVRVDGRRFVPARGKR